MNGDRRVIEGQKHYPHGASMRILKLPNYHLYIAPACFFLLEDVVRLSPQFSKEVVSLDFITDICIHKLCLKLKKKTNPQWGFKSKYFEFVL